MLRDTRGEAERDGLHFLTITKETGGEATARDMKEAANDTRNKIKGRKEQLLQKEVASGHIDAKVLDLAKAGETKDDRENRRQRVMLNLDRLRRAA